MRLGIDLDGVMYPFVDVFRLYAEQVKGVRFPPVLHWAFFEDWGMDVGEFLRLMDNGCKDGLLFHYGTPLYDCVAVMKLLNTAGHELVIATHRGKYAREATENWLFDWQIPYNELIFTDDKTTYGLDVLLDDCPDVIERFREAGGRGIVFDQPWNRDVDGERVHGWYQFWRKMTP